MADFKKTIAPGGVERINGNGQTYLFCKYASGPLRVELDGEATEITAGSYKEFLPLGTDAGVLLYNLDPINPINVILEMGTGTYDEKIVRGEIRVSPSIQRADGSLVRDTRRSLTFTVEKGGRDGVAFSPGDILQTDASGSAMHEGSGYLRSEIIDGQIVTWRHVAYGTVRKKVFDLEFTELSSTDYGAGDIADNSKFASDMVTAGDTWIAVKSRSSATDQIYFGALVNGAFQKSVTFTLAGGEDTYCTYRTESHYYHVAKNGGTLTVRKFTFAGELVNTTARSESSGAYEEAGSYSYLLQSLQWNEADQALYMGVTDWSPGYFYALVTVSPDDFGLIAKTDDFPCETNRVPIPDELFKLGEQFIILRDDDSSGTEGAYNARVVADAYTLTPELKLTRRNCDGVAQVIATPPATVWQSIDVPLTLADNVVSGEVVRALLESALRRAVPDGYLDHVFALTWQRTNDGALVGGQDYGSTSFAAVGAADDFSVPVPNVVTLSFDADLPTT